MGAHCPQRPRYGVKFRLWRVFLDFRSPSSKKIFTLLYGLLTRQFQNFPLKSKNLFRLAFFAENPISLLLFRLPFPRSCKSDFSPQRKKSRSELSLLFAPFSVTLQDFL